MIRLDAGQMALSRADLRRRDGARGEIATVEDRLLRVNAILSRRQLLVWRSLLWWVEQARQLAERESLRHPSAQTRAMQRVVDGLEDAVWEADALLTEARAENAGALAHLDEAIGALRIDLTYADRYKLQAAGLNERLDTAS